ncbi:MULTISPECIES: FxDxF family PEP-CTERM protein [unclassified Methylophilus]|uniref:FxDxF family PEP-CTERM protein n=1 Tax=unclassified Methylophilus TaxID=2630143 RepID=UPI00188F9602|nr:MULTISPECIES: FxDxF family PEP-CTERM protein [unclassified Methylophilus]MBF5039484.1 PEP-CTERM sorting domain-containing protein [Methylophilus sp. 13]MDF0377622.1 PEP-CTERM sorting domain-containing protein [Methylophilus sp. YYY-1]
MKKTFLALALLGLTQPAWAHLSYTGRDFGTFSGLVNASNSITTTVNTNYGWAGAADGNLGDSHIGRAFRFTLQNNAWVDFSVDATSADLLPAFSIYGGLAAVRTGGVFPGTQTSADYDSANASIVWRYSWAQANLGSNKSYTDTDGSWNALGNWKMGGDGDAIGIDSELSSFIYKGSATTATDVVTGKFLLGAGDYTIMIGGNNAANQLATSFGYTASLNVSAVPEPENMALLLTGLALVGWQVRRRSK